MGLRDVGVGSFQLVVALSIDERAIREIQKVIACSAVRPPIAGNTLISGEDFFRNNIDFGKPVEITLWVQEAVDMIDAQACDFAFTHQSEDVRVHRLKYILAFSSQCDEIVDIEKAPIINAICGLAPKRQTVMLPRKNLIQGQGFCAGWYPPVFLLVLYKGG